MVKHLLDLLSNQIVGGGLVLMVTGAVMAILRQVPMDIWFALKRQFLVELTIFDSEPIFEWMTIWLDKQPYSKTARSINLSTITEQHDGIMGESLSPQDARILFTPATGRHFFRFHGRPVWFERSSADMPGVGGVKSGRKSQSYLIKILGRDQVIAHELVKEILAVAHASTNRACAYISTFGYWRRLIAYRSRPLNTVDLPAGVKDRLLADIKRFLGAKQDYGRKGIPYHRGYLFAGPPGTGKTSLVSAIADELNLNLYVLNLVGPGMNDERLLDLMMSVRQRSIVIFEDIDAVVPSREARPAPVPGDKEEQQGVTLSGLLNCLDGIISPDGAASRWMIDKIVVNIAKELFGSEVKVHVRDEDVSRNLGSDYLIDAWPELVIDNTVPEGEIHIRLGDDLLARATCVGRKS